MHAEFHKMQVNQAIVGIHGVDVQFAGINFLESLVRKMLLIAFYFFSYKICFHFVINILFIGIWIFSIYVKCHESSKGISWAVQEVSWARLPEGPSSFSFLLSVGFYSVNWNFTFRMVFIHAWTSLFGFALIWPFLLHTFIYLFFILPW